MIKIDAEDLKKLARGLDAYQSMMPKTVASSALRRSVRPMSQEARRLAPKGKVKSSEGWGKYKGPEYARGGVTRRDVRTKMVPGVAGESARAVIGVSKKKGKVGWRTHFITQGFTDRGGRFHSGKNFLENAFESTIGVVRDNFGKEVLLSFQKWARRVLPKGKY